MNRALLMIALAGSTLGAMACESHPPVDPVDGKDLSTANAWLVRTYQDQQTVNGIVRQRTIYPHHFVVGTATLNNLGRRDLAVLAAHYREHPDGLINVNAGTGDYRLGHARIESIRLALAQAGVSAQVVTNGLAHGDGVDTSHVLEVLSVKDPVWEPHTEEDRK